MIQPSPMYDNFNRIDETFSQGKAPETPPFLAEDRLGREPIMAGQTQ